MLSMKKILLVFTICLSFLLSSCGETVMSAFAEAEDRASSIYRQAGISMQNVYSEEIEDNFAFAFGIGREEFDEYVEDAVCLRQAVDSKGQTLYVFETEAEKDALWLAEHIYAGYEWAPCDPSEKLVIASSGKYVMLFKSGVKEADQVLESFRSLMGGTLRFRKDLHNPG